MAEIVWECARCGADQGKCSHDVGYCERSATLSLIAGTWKCNRCGAVIEGAAPTHECPGPVSTPTNHPAAVAAAWTALEEAFAFFSVAQTMGEYEFRKNKLTESAEGLLVARRAAQAAGYEVALIGPRTMKFARKLATPGPISDDEYESAKLTLCARLIDDLAPLLERK